MTGYLSGIAAITVDCADAVSLAHFWRDLLGGEISGPDEDGVITVAVAGGPNLDFAPVPESRTVKNRLHLDLRSTDFDGAVAQAIDLGATRAPDLYDGDDWQVLRDPEGNEFCVLRP
ncbi:VOC family protein [Actinokineospora globicatena]|uniref:Glyoxalase n=1 Tax=Actinokineospora globicatena TaxID=103729 RepID=A0A9W6QI12_9PSEU|nr:VOC family protein [Actinokineospora globicatena]GLW90090.1 glyoxalase [Actinokineospora globicatena]